MKSHTLTAGLLLLVGCGGTEAHDHGHDHGTAHVAPPATSSQPLTAPPEAPLGAHRARLVPSAGELRLSLVDASGAAVPAAGEARVLLSGAGEEPQRVVLQANGTDWVGSAQASGAPGYVALVSVAVDGHTETARFVWGTVQTPELPGGHPLEEEHGDDHGHDHDH